MENFENLLEELRKLKESKNFLEELLNIRIHSRKWNEDKQEKKKKIRKKTFDKIFKCLRDNEVVNEAYIERHYGVSDRTVKTYLDVLEPWGLFHHFYASKGDPKEGKQKKFITLNPISFFYLSYINKVSKSLMNKPIFIINNLDNLRENDLNFTKECIKREIKFKIKPLKIFRFLCFSILFTRKFLKFWENKYINRAWEHLFDNNFLNPFFFIELVEINRTVSDLKKIATFEKKGFFNYIVFLITLNWYNIGEKIIGDGQILTEQKKIIIQLECSEKECNIDNCKETFFYCFKIIIRLFAKLIRLDEMTEIDEKKIIDEMRIIDDEELLDALEISNETENEIEINGNVQRDCNIFLEYIETESKAKRKPHYELQATRG